MPAVGRPSSLDDALRSIPDAPAVARRYQHYRDPLGVILQSGGTARVRIANGDRNAQMVVAPVVRATLAVMDTHDNTKKGQSGFGATGRG